LQIDCDHRPQASERSKIDKNLFRALKISIDDNDSGSFSGQTTCNSTPDPLCTTGYNGDFAGKPIRIHRFLRGGRLEAPLELCESPAIAFIHS
jgi:hypothetical protein